MLDRVGCGRRRLAKSRDTRNRHARPMLEPSGDLPVDVCPDDLLAIGSRDRMARGLLVMDSFELGKKVCEPSDRAVVEKEFVDQASRDIFGPPEVQRFSVHGFPGPHARFESLGRLRSSSATRQEKDGAGVWLPAQ